MSGMFVTGTGTGVGKTRAVALLLAAMRARGCDAVAIKAVQTGAVPGTQSEDLSAYCEIAGWLPDDAERYAPFLLRDPVSPHLAAEREGVLLTVAEIVAATRAAAMGHACSLVEGAGGILVPINRRETMRDLARALGLPVLIVAEAGLGTINHTLLTLHALREAEIEPCGVLLNAVSVVDPALAADNARTIAEMGATRVFGHVPHGATTPGPHIDAVADLILGG